MHWFRGSHYESENIFLLLVQPQGMAQFLRRVGSEEHRTWLSGSSWWWVVLGTAVLCSRWLSGGPAGWGPPSCAHLQGRGRREPQGMKQGIWPLLRWKYGSLSEGRDGRCVRYTTRGEGRGAQKGGLTLNAYLSLFVFIRTNNVMCYPRWCEQSFKPMEKTRPK